MMKHYLGLRQLELLGYFYSVLRQEKQSATYFSYIICTINYLYQL